MTQNKPFPYFRGVNYIGSFPDVTYIKEEHRLPCIAFMGRSNSGKSTLLSAVCDHKNLARASKTAGKTRLLNYYLLPAGNLGDQETYLIDTPGYGYAEVNRTMRSELGTILNKFLKQSEDLIAIVLVLDARRRIREEEAIIVDYCRQRDLTLVFARTRWDTMNAAEKAKAKKTWKEEDIFEYCIPVSSPKRIGLDNIITSLRTVFL